MNVSLTSKLCNQYDLQANWIKTRQNWFERPLSIFSTKWTHIADKSIFLFENFLHFHMALFEDHLGMVFGRKHILVRYLFFWNSLMGVIEKSHSHGVDKDKL